MKRWQVVVHQQPRQQPFTVYSPKDEVVRFCASTEEVRETVARLPKAAVEWRLEV